MIFVSSDNHRKPELIKAKEQELENRRAFDAYKEIQDNGLRILSTHWVVTEKLLAEEKKQIKPRLVIRGLKKKFQSDSSTASKFTFRTVMAVAASKRWKCEIIDI